jgi:DNA polymerase III subunit epsilon
MENEIVELAIIDLDGKVLFDSLIKHKQPIPEVVTSIHGMTNEDVKNAPTREQVYPVIKEI